MKQAKTTKKILKKGQVCFSQDKAGLPLIDLHVHRFTDECLFLSPVKEALSEAGSPGSSAVAHGLQDSGPSLSLPHSPVVWLPSQVCPVAHDGCQGSSHHLHTPDSQEKGRSVRALCDRDSPWKCHTSLLLTSC